MVFLTSCTSNDFDSAFPYFASCKAISIIHIIWFYQNFVKRKITNSKLFHHPSEYSYSLFKYICILPYTSARFTLSTSSSVSRTVTDIATPSSSVILFPALSYTTMLTNISSITTALQTEVILSFTTQTTQFNCQKKLHYIYVIQQSH